MKNWVQRGKYHTLKDVILSHISKEELTDDTEYPLPFVNEACQCIRDAIKQNKKIKIFGDYDCDGIMATDIILLMFRTIDYPVEYYIPKRFSDGYGLSEKLIDDVEPGTLIITVDNGIAAIDAIKKAKEKGCTVLLTDHHLAYKENGKIILPDADIIVDPCAMDGTEDELPYFHSICGATVAYKIAKVYLKDNPILTQMKSMAGIATIADVMPLIRENRFLVKDTLDLLMKRQSTIGINALLDKLDLQYITSDDVGFRLGPIINASGRMYDDGATRIAELILYPEENEELSYKVSEAIRTNEWRKEVQDKYLQQVLQTIEEEHLENDFPLIVYHQDIPEGIIGILAGRLAEDYKTPCVVFSDTENGLLKGSGRTYGNNNLKAILDENATYIYKYGGHPGAAGLSIKKEMLHAFREGMKKSLSHVERDMADYYDLCIHANNILDVLKELEEYAPYGEGNPKPVFKVEHFFLKGEDGFFTLLGNETRKHLKFSGQCAAIKFNVKEEEIPDRTKFLSRRVTLYGDLNFNFFNNVFYPQVQFIEYIPEIKQQNTALMQLLSQTAKNRESIS